MPDHQSAIDIVIPVYNAPHDLRECVDSVISHTVDVPFRLIIINDHSPDPEVERYLSELVVQHPEFIIERNAVNLGFVRTCNVGIAMSKTNDVVLLNSDVVVTPRWLLKLKECAYANSHIASVTPLTNSGTICSVPEFISDNVLPYSLTLDEYAEAIDGLSLKRYPSIPTGVGFCMYMTRHALNDIGPLDEENFGKGYGEENDWSYRATSAGYMHVMCDNVFIHHKGSQSFKEEKIRQLEQNMSVLGKMHPLGSKSAEVFQRKNEIRVIQDRIRAYLGIADSEHASGAVLFLTHNSPFHDENAARGGTEFHVLDLIENLDDRSAYVLYGRHPDFKTLALEHRSRGKLYRFDIPLLQGLDPMTLNSIDVACKLRAIINGCGIGIIHIQHLISHTLDIFDVASEMGIPLLWTLHDYYSICHNHQLVDGDGRYCQGKSTGDCKTCVAGKDITETFNETWKQKMRTYIAQATAVFAPSDFVSTLIGSTHGVHVKTIPHGIEIEMPASAPKNAAKDPKTLRCAYIGSVYYNKGSRILLDIAKANRQNKNFELHIFGRVFDREVESLGAQNLFLHGEYERGTITRILSEQEIDIVILPAIWPETYGYTIDEAIAARCPIIAFDIGAQGERVQALNVGWTVPIEDGSKGMIALIDSLVADKGLIDAKRTVCDRHVFKTLAEMTAEYAAFYDRYALASQANMTDTIALIDHFDFEQGSARNLMAEADSAEFNRMKKELDIVFSTLSWRVTQPLRELNLLFKRLKRKIRR